MGTELLVLKGICELIFNGLAFMLLAFLIFAIMYLLNIVAGIIENCLRQKKKFEFERLRNSIILILMALIISIALVVCFNILTIILETLGITIPETATTVTTIGSFIVLYIKGFIQTVNDLFLKIKGWFGINDTEYPIITEFTGNSAEDGGSVSYSIDGKG